MFARVRAVSRAPTISTAPPSSRNPQRRFVPRWALATSLVLASAFYPGTSHASLWGEENAPLYTLVTQGIQELAQGLESLAQLKATYDETVKYVGYVEDGIAAFEDFRRFGQDVLEQPDGLVDQLFPDAQAIRRAASGTGPWAQGTGELQQRVRRCLGKGAARGCTELEAAVSVAQARTALEQTFGTSPLKSNAVAALDYEASVALSSASASLGRGEVLRQQAQALLKRCTRGSSEGAIVACQAAAHAAGILQLQQLSFVTDALAEANRLQAVGLAQVNAEGKQRLFELEYRRDALKEGALRLAPPKVQLRTDGLDWFGGGR